MSNSISTLLLISGILATTGNIIDSTTAAGSLLMGTGSVDQFSFNTDTITASQFTISGFSGDKIRLGRDMIASNSLTCAYDNTASTTLLTYSGSTTFATINSAQTTIKLVRANDVTGVDVTTTVACTDITLPAPTAPVIQPLMLANQAIKCYTNTILTGTKGVTSICAGANVMGTKIDEVLCENDGACNGTKLAVTSRAGDEMDLVFKGTDAFFDGDITASKVAKAVCHTNSCAEAKFNIECDYDNGGCEYVCDGRNACPGGTSTITGLKKAECKGRRSCSNRIFLLSQTTQDAELLFEGDSAGELAIVQNFGGKKIVCKHKKACLGATIFVLLTRNHQELHLDCEDPETCKSLTINVVNFGTKPRTLLLYMFCKEYGSCNSTKVVKGVNVIIRTVDVKCDFPTYCPDSTIDGNSIFGLASSQALVIDLFGLESKNNEMCNGWVLSKAGLTGLTSMFIINIISFVVMFVLCMKKKKLERHLQEKDAEIIIGQNDENKDSVGVTDGDIVTVDGANDDKTKDGIDIQYETPKTVKESI